MRGGVWSIYIYLVNGILPYNHYPSNSVLRRNSEIWILESNGCAILRHHVPYMIGCTRATYQYFIPDPLLLQVDNPFCRSPNTCYKWYAHRNALTCIRARTGIYEILLLDLRGTVWERQRIARFLLSRSTV